MDSLLEVRNLCVSLMTARGIVYAVQGFNITMRPGEVHGIVGESGCGKSVATKSIMRLHDEERTEYTGSILFRGEEETDILSLTDKQVRDLRGREISMIFQDPMTSLNPIMKAGEQVAELVRKKRNMSREEAAGYVLRMFERVGIMPAEKRCRQYPFEMSGGMLQRVMIAMALACEPKILIADEPTTALDVTIQAQILQILKELQKECGTSVIFITHNLGVVAEICNMVSVMYAGRVIESGTALDIFDRAAHPYTQALLASNPRESAAQKRMETIEGTPPPLFERFAACPFMPRCRKKSLACGGALPPAVSVGADHTVACHLYS
jgi:oligopeptide/dipeptide ABC transporter ATP-binding protein